MNVNCGRPEPAVAQTAQRSPRFRWIVCSRLSPIYMEIARGRYSYTNCKSVRQRVKVRISSVIISVANEVRKSTNRFFLPFCQLTPGYYCYKHDGWRIIPETNPACIEAHWVLLSLLRCAGGLSHYASFEINHNKKHCFPPVANAFLKRVNFSSHNAEVNGRQWTACNCPYLKFPLV